MAKNHLIIWINLFSLSAAIPKQWCHCIWWTFPADPSEWLAVGQSIFKSRSR